MKYAMALNFKRYISALILFLGVVMQGKSQVKEGYFIKATGDTIHGLIKIGNERKMTDGFAYKEHGKDKTFKVYKPQEVKEVGFENQKFISALVPDSLINKVIFLKVLVEGGFNLYKATTGQNNTYFLFTTKEGDIRLLKKASYYGALKIGLPECSSVDFKDSKFLTKYKYTSAGLSKLFLEFNKCMHPQQVVTEYKKVRKLTFKKGITGGISNSTMNLTWPATDKANYGAYQNINIGLFGEVGFNKNLSVLVGAELHNYKGHASFDYANLYTTEIDFSTRFARIPVLFKYSLKGKLKPYINAGPHFNRLLGQSGNKKVSTIEHNYR
ncbi:outer membrane beta-barrel protein [Adhaeribacter rhizoryzae]|uniref:PorT family protein n=1 Tax=Adhaeribacter rhizoryzae TaxID=2607907 RepID=A0A5M6DJI4_9BACT|nr:outer membrane beta-barrel protein [Adhaeribacter rhizoryzae]KAA5546526.1 PorT family protein [Adhaeribacter rhizoryzae]